MRKQWFMQSILWIFLISLITFDTIFSYANEPIIPPEYFKELKDEIGQGGEANIDKKISGLLRMQIQLRKSYIKYPTTEGLAAMRQMGMRIVQTEMNKQLVSIHVKRKLSASKVTFLKKIGVVVYEDSWIPPLKNHPTGYVIASMSADQLYELARKPFVVWLETAEQILLPKNDEASKSINADDVWNDYGYSGTGVRIAILDSGLDTTHNDIPTPVTSKDYSNYPYLDDNIENLVQGHGTYVTGSALARPSQFEG